MALFFMGSRFKWGPDAMLILNELRSCNISRLYCTGRFLLNPVVWGKSKQVVENWYLIV